MIDGSGSGWYTRVCKNGVGAKKQGDSVGKFSSTSFLVLKLFGEANLGGPGLTSGALARGA
jgi:hypothetical protein